MPRQTTELCVALETSRRLPPRPLTQRTAKASRTVPQHSSGDLILAARPLTASYGSRSMEPPRRAVSRAAWHSPKEAAMKKVSEQLSDRSHLSVLDQAPHAVADALIARADADSFAGHG